MLLSRSILTRPIPGGDFTRQSRGLPRQPLSQWTRLFPGGDCRMVGALREAHSLTSDDLRRGHHVGRASIDLSL